MTTYVGTCLSTFLQCKQQARFNLYKWCNVLCQWQYCSIRFRNKQPLSA